MNQRFYTYKDFKELSKDLIFLDSWRLKEFLTFHLDQAAGSRLGWLTDLRKHLYVEEGFKDNNFPEIITLTYDWINREITTDAKKLHASSNFQLFKKPKDWTIEEYEINCLTVEEALNSPYQTDDFIKMIEAYEKLGKEYEDHHKLPAQNKLEISQLAVILVYEGRTIDREKAKEEVKKIGYSSGDKLYNKFNHYHKRANRIGVEATKKTTENKIELFESILPMLTEVARSKAVDELNTLKSSFFTEYN